jgi:glycosyltransferase involved in cell wall biosynthesis
MIAVPPLVEHELAEGFVRGRISIIMPAYNESDYIARSVADMTKQFRAVCSDYEIIVVDDGSIDGTWKIIENLTVERVKIVGYLRNQGKGHALKVGMHNATGELAFLVDSDLEIRPMELMSYVKALRSGADIVIGSKRHRLSSVQAPAMRKFLSLGFNILERLLTGVRASDTQAGLKAVRSAALYRLLPLLSVKKYAFDAELLAVATLLNYRIVELPVNIRLGASFDMKQVIRMMIDLLGIAYRLRVKRWYQKNSLTMTATYRPIIPW